MTGMSDTVRCTEALTIRIKPAGQEAYPVCEHEGCTEPGTFFIKADAISLCLDHAVQHLGEGT